MGETRGRKGKKSKWQITLGPKELIFAGMGLTGLIMLSFALGTLAGRGDIYRVLHNWGLLGPEAGKVVQVWPAASQPPATPAALPLAPSPQEAAPPPPASSTQALLSPSPALAPVEGAVTAPATPSHFRKKPGKSESSSKDPLEKLRREVAPRLKFQNSLDPTTRKTGRSPDSAKKTPDKGEKASLGKSGFTQIFVAKYRDGNQAKNQLAKMRSKGERVTLKEGKDNEGQYFALYREIPAGNPPAPAEKSPKSQSASKSGKSPH